MLTVTAPGEIQRGVPMSSGTTDRVGARGGEVELAVLATVLVHGPISRTALASLLSLSQSTMTRAVKPLLDRGLVAETSEQLEGPGRPSRPLVGAAGRERFVGIKLTGDSAFGVVTDLLANEHGDRVAPLPSAEPADVVDVIVDLVHGLADAASLTAVGVSLGGSAADGRTVDRAPFLGWRDVPLADLVEQRLGVPVIIDNDLSALTAGEHWFGVARGERDFAVVTVGAGIGLGMVREDQVVRSRDIGLGLAGHIPLDPTGPRCPLGHRGCSGAIVTIPAIETQAHLALQRPVAFDEVIRLAREGEPACTEIVDAAARGIGRLVALVANLAMVDTIVLSGDGLALLDVGDEAMRAQLAADRDPEAHDLDLRVDTSGFLRWARGASTVAIQASLPRLLGLPRD